VMSTTLPVYIYGQQVLTNGTLPVPDLPPPNTPSMPTLPSPFPWLTGIVSLMQSTLTTVGAKGIAATELGIPYKIFVTVGNDGTTNWGPTLAINPVITVSTSVGSASETWGSMSVPAAVPSPGVSRMSSILLTYWTISSGAFSAVVQEAW